MSEKTPAELWVEALRSGEFKQGRLALKTKDGHCCLGVACEVYQRVVGGLEVCEKETSSGKQKMFFNGFEDILPPVVSGWLGLTDNEGSFRHEGEREQWFLHELNDGDKDFNELADIIESRPPGLFMS